MWNFIKAHPPKSERRILFWLGIGFLIVGSTLIGFGIGRIFTATIEGTIIGFGLGLTISGFSLFKTVRRIIAFEKDE